MNRNFKPVIPPPDLAQINQQNQNQNENSSNSNENSNSNNFQSYFDPKSPLYHIHELIKANDIQGLKTLFSENPQYFDLRDQRHLYPIHYIILSGNLDMVKQIFPLSPNNKDKYDDEHHNLCYYAAITGNVDILYYLVNQAVSIQRYDGPKNQNIINILAQSNLPKGDKFEAMFDFIKSYNISFSNKTNYKTNALIELSTYSYLDDVMQFFKYDDLTYRYNNFTAYDLAMRYGNYRMYKRLQTLSDNKIRLNLVIPTLFNAAEGNNVQLFLDAVEYHNSPLESLYKGLTVLHYAAQKNANDIIYYLVTECNMDVNKKANGTTPLQCACREGQAKACQALLDLCADPEISSDQGNYALHFASGFNRIDCVRILIDNGADIEKKNSKGNTPILHAAIFGHLKASKILLHHGANLHVVDSDGSNLLHWACYWSDIEMIQILLDLNFDINAKNNKGETPLHMAIMNATVDCVEYLLSHGADPHATSNNGNNLLHFGALSRKIGPLEYILNHFNFNINGRNSENMSPIMIATTAGLAYNIQRLYNRHANINVQQNNNDDSLLILAAKACKKTSFQYLSQIFHISTASDRRGIRDRDGNTPLHLAAMKGNYEFAQYLISEGYEIDIKNRSGNTPSYYAQNQRLRTLLTR